MKILLMFITSIAAYGQAYIGSQAVANSPVAVVNGGTGCTTPYAVNPQTSTYQALGSDFTCLKTIGIASGTFTITLVASGTQPAAGLWVRFNNYGSGVITIARSGQNINGGTSSITLAAASATGPTSVYIQSDGTNYFAGDLTPAASGSTAFNAVSTGSNTTATMTCGTGCTMTISGSGTINGTSIDGLGETSTATPSKLAARDANGNLLAVGFLDNVTSTATDGSSTVTLLVGSSQTQKSTGSTTLTYQLPVTSTLALNQKFYFNNLSTGAVTVNSSGGNAVIILAGGTSAVVKCILTSGTSAASWSVAYAGMLITSGKAASITNSITLSGTDAKVYTFPTTDATIARTDAAQTFTGTQTFGAIVGTTFNGNTFTTGSGVLTLAALKTFTVNNTITLAGTDSTIWTGPNANFSVARIDAAQTFTGTQTFGAIVGTTFNGNTFTTGTGVLTIAAGKTATVNNTITLAGTDAQTYTFPTTTATIARTDAANTFTGHQTIEGVTSTGATGTALLVFGTSPTLTTPTIGVATATSINKMAITAPATLSTLAVADGKTLTASNSITLAGTDSTTMTFPAVSATIPRVVASGSSAVDFASTATGACATLVTVSATGVASTDTIIFNANASVKAVTGFVPASTGGFSIAAYPTTNNVNFEGCNWTSGTVDPGSITLNYTVIR